MDFLRACNSMQSGITVESLVSYTTYTMSKEGLRAEGIVVPFDHLTDQEANGEWREVEVLETMEQVNSLSPDETKQLLDDAIKHYDFHQKNRTGG